MIEITVLPRDTRSETFNGPDIYNSRDCSGIMLYLNIEKVSGTKPTLDIKLQALDRLSKEYFDIQGSAFTQKTAAGQDYLRVEKGMPLFWRVVVDIGGKDPSFRFSVGGVLTHPNS